MIPPVGDFVPFGAPDSPVRRMDPRVAQALLAARAARPSSDDPLADVLRRAFDVTLLEALNRAAPAASARVPAAAPVDASSTAPPAQRAAGTDEVSTPAAPTSGTAPDEAEVIHAAASRAAIDARFLEAIRRVENGGPGREFGVLSVPAPTIEDQARVAATTVRKNVERFEQAGHVAIDPASGRYTEEFIRFFSDRYAPVGAANDPNGLNRYHARNLVRLYAQLAPK